MTVTNDAVRDRIARVRLDIEPTHLLAVVALAAAIGFLLLFGQEPVVHDSLHNFRHAAGVTCH